MAQERTPPLVHRRGERRALDQQWLRYLNLHPAADWERLEAPPRLAEAVEQLNDGKFIASHEMWEALWREASYPTKLFFLAMAKLTAGLEQARRGNRRGALRLTGDSLQFLEPFRLRIMGLNTAQLWDDVHAWAEQHRKGEGPLDPSLAPISFLPRSTQE